MLNSDEKKDIITILDQHQRSWCQEKCDKINQLPLECGMDNPGVSPGQPLPILLIMPRRQAKEWVASCLINHIQSEVYSIEQGGAAPSSCIDHIFNM